MNAPPLTIDAALLVSAGVQPAVAALHAPHLAEAAARFGINTQRRVAAFLGQVLHESLALTRLEEDLDYRDPARIVAVFGVLRTGGEPGAAALVRNPQRLANVVYANRYGNGDVASGDGWRYRGRGAGHLTFRHNYRDAGRALGRPYEAEPDLVAQPPDAAMSFAWYWHTRQCNTAADRWDIRGVTARINPAMAGAPQRQALCAGVLACLRESEGG